MVVRGRGLIGPSGGSCSWLWFLQIGRRGKRGPGKFRVEGSVLVVSTKLGRELWRHTFDEELLDSYYAVEVPRGCQFADLCNDTEMETIFSVVPRARTGERSIICFNSGGKPRWKFVPGTTVIDNLGRSFAPPYWASSFQRFDQSRPLPRRLW
jgi:hypothetical protein